MSDFKPSGWVTGDADRWHGPGPGGRGAAQPHPHRPAASRGPGSTSTAGRRVRHQPHPGARGPARAVLRGPRRRHPTQRHHRHRASPRGRRRQLRRARRCSRARPPSGPTERHHRPTSSTELRDLAAAIPGADDVVAANRAFHRAVNRCSRLTAPAHPPAPGVARRARPTTSSCSPSRSHDRRPSTPSSSPRWPRRDGAEASRLAEAHVLVAGEALGDWLTRETIR